MHWIGLFILGCLIHFCGTPPSLHSGEQVAQLALDSESARFFFIGDSGHDNPAKNDVVNAMERRCQTHKPTGIILLGDNFYQEGVDSIDDPQWESKFTRPFGQECLGDVPVFAILGNHDYRGNPTAQIEYSNHSDQWHMPARHYSRSFGDLLEIIAIDTEILDACFNPARCAVDFLNSRVKQRHTRWQIVTTHHPLSSASANTEHRYTGDEGSYLLKKLFCGDVDLWIAAHAHHLEHRQEPSCETDLYISGGGGGSLRDVNPEDPFALFARTTYGYLEINFHQQGYESRFFDRKGDEMYLYDSQAESAH